MKVEFNNPKEDKAVNEPGDEGRAALDKILNKEAPSCTEKELAKTLNLLRAAPNLDEQILKAYHLHALSGDHHGEFAIDIRTRQSHGRGKYRMLLKPTSPEQFQDGNLSTVTEITITKLIEDYH